MIRIRPPQTGQHGIQIVKARRNAGELIAVGTAELLHRVDDLENGLADGLDTGLVAAGADVIDLLLCTFQQQIGVLAGGCLAQDTAGRIDQAAGLILLLDDLEVGIDIGDGGHRLGNAGDVDLGVIGAGKGPAVGKGVDQRDDIDRLALGIKRAHRLIDGTVLVRVEHLRFHVCDQAVQHRLIHQRGAQHALLGLHIVGHLDAQTGQAYFLIFRHGGHPLPSRKVITAPRPSA